MIERSVKSKYLLKVSAGLLAIFILTGGGLIIPAAAENPQSDYGPKCDFVGTAASNSDAVPAAPVTHIEVGTLLTVDKATPISRLYIADPSVLESYIASPKQIVLNAKMPGATSVMLWDNTGKQQILRMSVDLRTEELCQSLRAALPSDQIQVRAVGNRIILAGTLGTRAKADEAIKLAGLFSKEVVDTFVVNAARTPQVELKVRFIEVDRSRLNQFGINLFGPGGSSAVGAGTTGQFASTATLSTSGGGGGASVSGGVLETLSVSNPLNFLFFSTKLGTGVTVQDLENKHLAQILAEPTITTLSGQNASFLAGGEFPFPVVQGGSAGLTSITIQFRPYGVKLDFTPKVNIDGTIELKVTPEVSSLDYTNAVTISGYTIPAISTKHADTQVVLRSGQSFAISGLLDKQTTDSLARTPGLASIPILGTLFKSKGINLSTSELMVIVTPTIVDPLAGSSGPNEPVIVRPMLNEDSFDKSIGPKQFNSSRHSW